MINLLKTSFIIILCLLINERNAFSDHYKAKDLNRKVFKDDSDRPITKKNIIIKYKTNGNKTFKE